MKKYYAIYANYIKGLEKSNRVIDFATYIRNYYSNQLYKTDFNYLDVIQSNDINQIVPQFILLEKINEEFYEVFTGLKIMSENEYSNKQGLCYQECYNNDIKNNSVCIDAKECHQYVENWTSNSEEKMQVFKTFIKESNENFGLIYDKKCRLINDCNNLNVEMVKKF